MFKYSVPDEVLDQLVDLFRSWGISERRWALTVHHAAQRYGYYFVDPRNPRELDIIINKYALPWKIKNNEWTGIPPKGTL